VPVVGGLIVGLIARYGSERIRGHGIPEAMEAILIGQSRMSPKVALLKPISSAISIGSGGPFGAEGPIIMTGGSFGSIIAQAFHLTAAERKTLLVAGAAGGMAATFNTPMARRASGRRTPLVRMEATEPHPGRLGQRSRRAPEILPTRCRADVPGRGTWDPAGGRPDRIGRRRAAAGGVGAGVDGGRLRGRGYLPPPADPLDVVAALGGLVVGVGGLIQPQALG